MAITPFPPTSSSSSSTTTKVDTANFTGNNVQDTFVIPHGMSAKPRYANTVAQNPNSIGDISVIWDATNIVVMFSVAPSTGPLILTWIAVL